MKTKFSTVIGIVLLIKLLCAPVIGQNRVNVTGRVVDFDGEPVEKAYVELSGDPCDKCTDIINSSTYSTSGGFFAFSDAAILSEFRIFIAPQIPNGYWCPVASKSLLFAKYPGVKIRVGRKPLKVGNVRPTLRYLTADIDLSRLFTAVEISTIRKGRPIRLYVSDFKKGIEIASEVPLSALDNGAVLKLSLPHDRWIVSLSLGEKNAQTRLSFSRGKSTAKRFVVSYGASD